MWSGVLSYLKFLWKSTNEHGVHSPFVFALVTQCLYDKKTYPEYERLADFRKRLLSDDRIIDVTDFGAGSQVFTSNSRKISAIARTAGVGHRRAKMLFRLVRRFRPENMLEIGTSVGLATSALSMANPKACILTLEGCPETARIANEHFQRSGLSNIEQNIGRFDTVLTSQLPDFPSFGLVYFDGNHTKAATLSHFEKLLPTATNDSVWIFDDIHWSKGMEEAWAEIKRNPAVTVTIDTYQWGLVFFRSEQAKEHFTIRA